MIFDSDVLIWYLRGNQRAADSLRSARHMERQTSAIVLMELLAGCRDGHEAWTVEKLLQSNFSRVLHVDEHVSGQALRLMRRHARREGLRPVDALVAATALVSGQPLLTGNERHYRFIDGLKVQRFRP